MHLYISETLYKQHKTASFTVARSAPEHPIGA